MKFLNKLNMEEYLDFKYGTTELKLCRPNIVVVFSNDRPEITRLASDSWAVFLKMLILL